MYPGAGVGDYTSSGRGAQKNIFLSSSQTAPRPLSTFDTHARWQPVTQSARSRRSHDWRCKDDQQYQAARKISRYMLCTIYDLPVLTTKGFLSRWRVRPGKRIWGCWKKTMNLRSFLLKVHTVGVLRANRGPHCKDFNVGRFAYRLFRLLWGWFTHMKIAS